MAALRWVDPAGFRTTANTVVSGLAAYIYSGMSIGPQNRKVATCQLEDILQANSSRGTNDDVRRHCKQNARCEWGLVKFIPRPQLAVIYPLSPAVQLEPRTVAALSPW